MKKLIALLLLAGFITVTAGCPSTTTTSAKVVPAVDAAKEKAKDAK